MTRHATRHGNETLRRAGAGVMILGFLAAILPAPSADPFATAHEFYEMAGRQLWWWFGGLSALVLGNTLRLIGAQGHPGLPWPLAGPRVPHELVARVQLRRRARENRAKALDEAAAPSAA